MFDQCNWIYKEDGTYQSTTNRLQSAQQQKGQEVLSQNNPSSWHKKSRRLSKRQRSNNASASKIYLSWRERRQWEERSSNNTGRGSKQQYEAPTTSVEGLAAPTANDHNNSSVILGADLSDAAATGMDTIEDISITKRKALDLDSGSSTASASSFSAAQSQGAATKILASSASSTAVASTIEFCKETLEISGNSTRATQLGWFWVILKRGKEENIFADEMWPCMEGKSQSLQS